MKNLENFIRMHRNEFDVYQPSPELWSGIAAGLSAPVALPKPGKFLGTGGKNLLLLSVATSAIVAVGIWKFKGEEPKKTSTVPVTESVENIDRIEEEPRAGVADVKTPATPRATALLGAPHIPAEAITPPVLLQPDIQTPLPHFVAGVAEHKADTSFSGIKKLSLKCAGYTFRIKRSESNLTTVRILKPAEVKNKENLLTILKMEQHGTELLFAFAEEDKRHRWGNNFHIVSPGEIEILIPEQQMEVISSSSSDIELSDYTTGDLSMHTVSGGINANRIKGKLSITTASGDQTLVEISGELHCTSVSGNVRISEVEGKLTSISASGDQFLSDVKGDVHCTTVSGDVSLKNQSGSVKIHTSGGEVTVSNCTGNLSCRTISGDVNLEAVEGRVDVATSSGDISGETITLSQSCIVQTISGDVKLGLKNPAEELRFELTSVSGNLKVKKGGIAAYGEKTLTTGAGKILVKGETSSGDQLFR